MPDIPTTAQIEAEQKAAIFRKQLTERLMDQSVLKEAFAEVEKLYLSDWKAGRTTEAREAAWYALRALEDVQTKLRRYITDGTVAQDKVKRAESAAR